MSVGSMDVEWVRKEPITYGVDPDQGADLGFVFIFFKTVISPISQKNNSLMKLTHLGS